MKAAVPTNYELERNALATLMIEHPSQASSFEEELFWYPEHKLFLEALKRMHAQGIGNDFCCVHMVVSPEEYRLLGGIKGVTAFGDAYQRGTELSWLKEALKNLAVQRRVMLGLMQGVEGFDSKPFKDLLCEQKKLLEDVSPDKSLLLDFHDGAGDFLSQLDKRMEYYQRTGMEYREGFDIGIRAVDERVQFLMPGEMSIIAARPGAGKTAFLLSIAYNLVQVQTANVAMMCYEMSTPQLQLRLASIASGVPMHQLSSGSVRREDREHVEKMLTHIESGTLMLQGGGSSMVEDVVEQIEIAAALDIKVIMIDYIGLINSGAKRFETRQAEVQHISKTLRRAATKHQVALLVASQVSRKVDERADARPGLSDLKESGQIEQDASVVGFLYKEDGFMDQIKLDIAKNRSGVTATIPLHFLRERSLIEGRCDIKSASW